ncbi:MAG: response regulator transcription factor [Nitrospiraceae bacterium]|nr:response regulator transcription factor [candidate division NC10 bacterium]MEC4687259.1 response regulator transcription factor [Nitrospirota bacterium]
MKRPRVLLADDHKIVVEGLRNLLEPEFELVGTVEDGRALVAAAAELRPDVIVADISMPLLNGIEAARQIKKADSGAKIVFLTMHPDVTYATRAFEAGASGYVLKHSAPSELVTAIREALKGRTYVTPMIAKDVLESFMDRSHKREDVFHKLTPRQREILQLVTEGRSAKEIASLLNISPRTVEFHKYRMMEDLGLRTNAELIQFAIKHGLASV